MKEAGRPWQGVTLPAAQEEDVCLNKQGTEMEAPLPRSWWWLSGDMHSVWRVSAWMQTWDSAHLGPGVCP